VSVVGGWTGVAFTAERGVDVGWPHEHKQGDCARILQVAPVGATTRRLEPQDDLVTRQWIKGPSTRSRDPRRGRNARYRTCRRI